MAIRIDINTNSIPGLLGELLSGLLPPCGMFDTSYTIGISMDFVSVSVSFFLKEKKITCALAPATQSDLDSKHIVI